MSAPVDHPGPWRWVIDDLGESSLWDSRGGPLAVNASSAVDPDVAELIQRAPEMAEVLKWLVPFAREMAGLAHNDRGCVERDDWRKLDDADALLARIDRAKAGG